MEHLNLLDKLPKKYRKFICQFYKDSDGVWCFLKEGFYFDHSGSSICHENSVSLVLDYIRKDIVKNS